MEQQRISEELGELGKKCTSTIRAFLIPLLPNEGISLDAPPDDNAFHALNFKQFPTPRQIADALTAELQKPNRTNMKLIGVGIAVEGCETFNFTRSPEGLSSLSAAIRDKPALAFDGKKLNELRDRFQKLNEDLQFQSEVRRQLYSQKVFAAAGSKEVAADAQPGENLTIRLVQTSVTRFGLLAVIGFFVALLVSLYRYNVRLAAYYMARADFFRIFGEDVLTTSEKSAIMMALTPGIEFGKMPATPAMQILELLKSAKKD